MNIQRTIPGEGVAQIQTVVRKPQAVQFFFFCTVKLFDVEHVPDSCRIQLQKICEDEGVREDG